MMLRFAGIENEFQVMEKGSNEVLDFRHLFQEYLKTYPHPRFDYSGHCMRTRTGASVYADGMEAEVCTPPTLVEPGFASRAADALYLARQDLIDFVQDRADLVGYTTHWGFTATDRENELFVQRERMQVCAPLWGLFTLTPISRGINLRAKEYRNELLGDYIENLEQVKSLLLLYSAGLLAPSDSLPPPIIRRADAFNAGYAELLPDGRHTVLCAQRRGSFSYVEMTAQQHAQNTYEVLAPIVRSLGTPSEIQTLEEFLDGRRHLEIDRFAKHVILGTGKTHQLRLENTALSRVPTENYANPCDLPTPMARFLGAIARSTSPPIEMTWSTLAPQNDYHGETRIECIDDFEVVARLYTPEHSWIDNVRMWNAMRVNSSEELLRRAASLDGLADNFSLSAQQRCGLRQPNNRLTKKGARYRKALRPLDAAEDLYAKISEYTITPNVENALEQAPSATSKPYALADDPDAQLLAEIAVPQGIPPQYRVAFLEGLKSGLKIPTFRNFALAMGIGLLVGVTSCWPDNERIESRLHALDHSIGHHLSGPKTRSPQ